MDNHSAPTCAPLQTVAWRDSKRAIVPLSMALFTFAARAVRAEAGSSPALLVLRQLAVALACLLDDAGWVGCEVFAQNGQLLPGNRFELAKKTARAN